MNTTFSSQATQFRQQGYCVFEDLVEPDLLDGLRTECQRAIDDMDAEMDRAGVDSLRLNQRGRRYFVRRDGANTPALRRFLFSDLMAEICKATIGESAYLFNDQYVVKGPERGTAFAWHQDGAYIRHDDQAIPHAPTLTCWCPLDDVTEENGTVYLLPYDRAGTRELVAHERDSELHDLVGYRGDDPGDPVVVPAASVVCFSSTVLHRSGPNTTSQMRRVYVVDYSPEPINKPGTTEPLRRAVPFLVDGRRVAEPGE